MTIPSSGCGDSSPHLFTIKKNGMDMKEKPEELPFLSNIGLMLTYRCTVACPHCIVEAGPHRKEKMSLENVYRWTAEAAHYEGHRIKGLALTGGEPFFDIGNLRIVSDFGEKSGFVVSVVTNAFWAGTKERAMQTLSGLSSLRMISFSTDVYHMEKIPLENVKNGIRAATELGIMYNVALCTDNLEDEGYRKIKQEILSLTGGKAVRTAITFPVGRAQENAGSFRYSLQPEPSAAACTTASSPVIFPDGKVMACIGPVMKINAQHPMFLGNLNDEPLSQILDRAEKNAVLHSIRTLGPRTLVSLLKEEGMDHLVPDEFMTDCPCDVCYKLFSDREVCRCLTEISERQEYREKIAYARLYYLNENCMVESL